MGASSEGPASPTISPAITLTTTRRDIYGNPAVNVVRMPGGRSFIFGGLLEVQLTRRFAIEANVLHRPLTGIQHQDTEADNLRFGGPARSQTFNIPSATTWEFPVMLKWNVPSPLLSRANQGHSAEGGPQLPHFLSLIQVLLLQFGVTALCGRGRPVWPFAPGAHPVRYTRWEKDEGFPAHYPVTPDQFEFLTSIAWGTGVRPGASVRTPAPVPGSSPRTIRAG